jgi:hypothetical protein
MVDLSKHVLNSKHQTKKIILLAPIMIAPSIAARQATASDCKGSLKSTDLPAPGATKLPA